MNERTPEEFRNEANRSDGAAGSSDRAALSRLLSDLRTAKPDGEDGDAFSALMERYLSLIEKTVDRFAGEVRTAADREDLRQEALLSFYGAAMSYDLSQSRVTFGLYAQICMTNRLISCARRMNRADEEEPIPTDYPADAPTADPSVSVVAGERLARTYAVLRRVLSPFEFRVWECYLGGSTAKEIAELLGREEKAITNAIGRIRRKIRAARKEFEF